MITFKTPKHHWNYFIALENDLKDVSRYIEFCDDNLKAYSIELTHILLSASSEIDVVMKQLCKLSSNSKKAENINDYKKIVKKEIPSFINEEIVIDRFGLSHKPWENWNGNSNPDWWKSYNNVKHERNNFFNEANLQNTINAVGGLLITVVYYYKYAFEQEAQQELSFREVIRQLSPESSFLKMNASYYGRYLVI